MEKKNGRIIATLVLAIVSLGLGLHSMLSSTSGLGMFFGTILGILSLVVGRKSFRHSILTVSTLICAIAGIVCSNWFTICIVIFYIISFIEGMHAT